MEWDCPLCDRVYPLEEKGKPYLRGSCKHDLCKGCIGRGATASPRSQLVTCPLPGCIGGFLYEYDHGRAIEANARANTSCAGSDRKLLPDAYRADTDEQGDLEGGANKEARKLPAVVTPRRLPGENHADPDDDDDSVHVASAAESDVLDAKADSAKMSSGKLSRKRRKEDPPAQTSHEKKYVIEAFIARPSTGKIQVQFVRPHGKGIKSEAELRRELEPEGFSRFSHLLDRRLPWERSKMLDDGIDHDDCCMVCNDGGDLLLCDTCPCVFHNACVGLSQKYCLRSKSLRCAICRNQAPRARNLLNGTGDELAGIVGFDASRSDAGGRSSTAPILSVGQHVWVRDGKAWHAAVIKSLPPQYRAAKISRKQDEQAVSTGSGCRQAVATVRWDSNGTCSEIEIGPDSIRPMHEEQHPVDGNDTIIGSSKYSKRKRAPCSTYSLPDRSIPDGRWSSKLDKHIQHDEQFVAKYTVGGVKRNGNECKAGTYRHSQCKHSREDSIERALPAKKKRGSRSEGQHKDTPSYPQDEYEILWNLYMEPVVRVDEELPGGVTLREKKAMPNLQRFKSSVFRQKLHTIVNRLNRRGEKAEIYRMLKSLHEHDMKGGANDGPSDLVREILPMDVEDELMMSQNPSSKSTSDAEGVSVVDLLSVSDGDESYDASNLLVESHEPAIVLSTLTPSLASEQDKREPGPIEDQQGAGAGGGPEASVVKGATSDCPLEELYFRRQADEGVEKNAGDGDDDMQLLVAIEESQKEVNSKQKSDADYEAELQEALAESMHQRRARPAATSEVIDVSGSEVRVFALESDEDDRKVPAEVKEISAAKKEDDLTPSCANERAGVLKSDAEYEAELQQALAGSANQQQYLRAAPSPEVIILGDSDDEDDRKMPAKPESVQSLELCK